MYMFHMWIVLQDSPHEEEEAVVDSKLQPLRRLLEERFGWSRSNHDPIVVTNGTVIINTSLSTNHRGVAHTNLLETLKWIGAELPGSYGLVYWLDDEDPSRDNRFEVIVMKRGGLEHKADELLSPLNPTIED